MAATSGYFENLALENFRKLINSSRISVIHGKKNMDSVTGTDMIEMISKKLRPCSWYPWLMGSRLRLISFGAFLLTKLHGSP